MFFVSICCRSIPKVPNATILCRALTAVIRQWESTSIPTSATCTLSAPARAGWDEHIDECSESSNTLHMYKFIYIKYISTNSFPGIPTHLCRGHPFQCGHRGMHVWGRTIVLHSFYLLLIIGGGGLQGAKREASYRIKRKEQWNKSLNCSPLFTVGQPW